MTRRLRVFISSPSDVRDAREVIAQIVEKVSQDYLRYFTFEPYLWETEALLASGHFQDAIEPPSQFDVVALLLWARLGTPLPEETSVRRYEGMDGRTPVTGSEWEFEDALRGARESGLPDLLVYRSRLSAAIDVWDPRQREEQLHQLEALDRFWSRHFASQGQFIGAYHEFSSLRDLAFTFENHLRRLADRRVAQIHADRTGEAVGRLWTRPPFRGLQAYGYDDAPIFFGRADATGRALTQLIANANAGSAFLMVLGASGSGKSSLAMAGILPRLALPGRVYGRTFLRRCVFRPADRAEGEDLFDAFARVLARAEGAGVGLPEVGRPQTLAAAIRDAPIHAAGFIVAALAAAAGDGADRLAREDAALVLVVDQMERLWTDPAIMPAHRRAFADLLAALVAGGQVWVIATLRSDLWHLAADTPQLVDLAQGTGRFDLLAPRPAEIAQMIRLPAEAAGVAFEADAANGLALDDVIAEAADGAPGALPLLSYLLEQLYQADVAEAGGSTLTYAAYDRLGGLQGAIAARAEAVLAEPPPEVRAALPAVLFALVQTGADGVALTARTAALAEFPREGPQRQLIDALSHPAARLVLVGEGAGAQPTLRLAHEALLTAWGRARDLLANEARLLTIRHSLEDRRRRWAADSGAFARPLRPWSTDLRLLNGADLADARRLVDARGEGLPADLATFIQASFRQERFKRRRGLAMTAAAAGVITAVAIGGGLWAFSSLRDTQALQINQAMLHAADDGDDAIHAHNAALALAKYGQEIAGAQQEIALQPEKAQWRLNLAIADGRMAYALRFRDAPGDRVKALEFMSEARTGLQQTAAIDASVPGVRQDREKLQAQLAWLAKYF